MKWLCIGPNQFSGIGHVMKKYAQSVHGELCEYGQDPCEGEYDVVFMFMLPVPHFQFLERYSRLGKKLLVMTVCETETVHHTYERFRQFKTVLVPSQFCARVLSRQFPSVQWRILHHVTESVPKTVVPKRLVYTFYTIGNVMDPRKNIKMLLEAFIRMNIPETRLVIKATCMQPVRWNIPRVTVINSMLDEKQMNTLHDACDVYINCSHSEGVGMGAVEAALRDKPVIITDYGGLKEYVKTPWVVPCTLGPVGLDDFLFEKDMVWGHPDKNELVKHMNQCFMMQVKTWDHSHTRTLVENTVKHLYEYQDDTPLVTC